MSSVGSETEEALPELSQLRGENRALRRAIALLHEISTLVRSAQELEPTCYALLTGVTAGVGLSMNRAAIFLVDATDGWLHGLAAVGPMDEEEADRVWKAIEEDGPDLQALYEAGLEQRDRPGRLDRAVRALTVDPRGQSPLALALRRGRLVVGEGDDDLGGLWHLPSVLASPLRGTSRIRGVLVADRRFTRTTADAGVRLVFDLLADHAGRAVENAERFERLAREARTDALTGLGSRRSFDERLEEMAAAALIDGPSVGLLLIDLDDFKHLNDTYGHPAGDKVLGEVGRRLGAALRPGEGFRYGGEEMAVVLAGVRQESLTAAADRIWKAVTDEPVDLPGAPRVRIGCSIGGALLPGRAEDAPGLVQAADDALLRAKKEGKNRIRFA
ncbi:MAG TPA: sensor domain-containing diguanylate cyclase [Sandaracinaceae bacterium LLY-WYZ-13_1]|nr:sensor domain-containing diguanylate cyclase [Sandaracinaceae bacterium LLY-WYZ-13_1]